jgi:hypothetical protein
MFEKMSLNLLKIARINGLEQLHRDCCLWGDVLVYRVVVHIPDLALAAALASEFVDVEASL